MLSWMRAASVMCSDCIQAVCMHVAFFIVLMWRNLLTDVDVSSKVIASAIRCV